MFKRSKARWKILGSLIELTIDPQTFDQNSGMFRMLVEQVASGTLTPEEAAYSLYGLYLEHPESNEIESATIIRAGIIEKWSYLGKLPHVEQFMNAV